MNLEEYISLATDAIDTDVAGHLSLSHRKKIWRLLLSSEALATSEQRGHEVRLALDVLCVKRALPIWEQAFPYDNSPLDMIALAYRAIDNEVSTQEAQRLRDNFYVELIDDRDYREDQVPAMFVAHAAANTVITAMIKNIKDAIPTADDDQDLDPDAYLPSYLCASACAGSLNGHQENRILQRRKFWKWYLLDAIPIAMKEER